MTLLWGPGGRMENRFPPGCGETEREGNHIVRLTCGINLIFSNQCEQQQAPTGELYVLFQFEPQRNMEKQIHVQCEHLDWSSPFP